MEHLYGLESLRGRDSCVAFGSFDGLHIGHRAVIGRMAEFPGLERILLSFERTDRPFFLTESEKAFLLKDAPVDCLLSVPEPEMKHLSAQDFVQRVLLDRLHALAVVAGGDSVLRSGLSPICASAGLSLVSVPTVCSEGSPVSKELMEQCLESGSFRTLLDLLGHPYILQGTVVHGKGKGRTADMPTANIGFPKNKILPHYGVYGSLVHLKDGVRIGLTNVGLRPSVDNSPVPTVETYILDFSGNLYGQELVLEIREWIRDTKKFSGGLKAVKEQVGRDIEYVRSVMTV